jgi:hypothetical protein
MFSERTCERIGLYVYRLIDPRNGETFYVGRGRKNRVFQHAKGEVASTAEEDAVGAKLSRISEIRQSGLEVLHVIHRHDLQSNEVASEVEAALIDAYPGLTNAQSGSGSGDRGPMNHKEIEFKYGLPALSILPTDRLILININNIANRASPDEVYDQVRYAWRIDTSRASKAEFVLAVVKGVVVGAFEVHRWLPASVENFPDLLHPRSSIPGRSGFIGVPASPEAWGRFVGDHGRRIEDPKLKHVQNPVRYWNV